MIQPGSLVQNSSLRCLAGNVGINAEPARPGAGVVFLPDVGEIDVADLILVVEGDEQTPVADRNVTWHGVLSRVNNGCSSCKPPTRAALIGYFGNPRW